MSQTSPQSQSDQTEQPEKPRFSSRPPAEKVATVLALLDNKTLQSLSGRIPDHVRDRLLEVARNLKSVPHEEQQRIAKEFVERLSQGRNAVRGSDTVAKRLDGLLFSKNPALPAPEEEEDDEEIESPEGPATIWDKLSEVPPKVLINFFKEKPPILVSIAMRQLKPDVASEVASQLPEDLAKDGLVQIATMNEPNEIAIEAVERLLEAELLGEDAPTGDESNPGADQLAAILNRLTSTRRDMILEELKNQLSGDKLAEVVSKVLTFDALEDRLPRSAIPVVFREIDEKELLTALNFAAEKNSPVADYMLNNISQRLAGTYREKMADMASVSVDDGEKAQSKIICKILEFVGEGRITLIEPEEEEAPTEE